VADPPRVSVCVPAYDAEPHIGGTLDSILGQTERDLEVVVVDDQSHDRTVELLRARDDPRLRVEVNPRNLGPVPTTNRAIEPSRGRYVKVVHADDWLEPDCLAKMAGGLDRHPSAGLAFARRAIDIVPDAGRSALWWANAHREVDRGFGELSELNSGGEMFDRWLRQGLLANWVGEPTSVLLRRATLERVGLFAPRVLGYHDVDLWARVLLVSDAVFLPEPLTHYRTGQATSLTLGLRGSDADWLQRLWVYEGLLTGRLDGWRRDWVAGLRRNERREVAKDAARMGARGPSGARRVLRDLGAYAAYRARARLGRAPALHPALPPA
jgi:glycosyltransferase involved in cell wall biosynthesis